MHCGSGWKIIIGALGRSMPSIFACPPATMFPSLFTEATWKRPETRPLSTRNRTANLSTRFPLEGTVDEKMGHKVLLNHPGPRKQTMSQPLTILPDSTVRSGYELEWPCWRPFWQFPSAYSRFLPGRNGMGELVGRALH